jgi:integrase
MIPLVPRTARTIDLAVGKRREGPILLRRGGQRLDRRTAHRWVRSIGKRAGLRPVHPHMLRAAFIMTALDAGVPLRDVQIAARHADPRTTTIYDRRRQTFDTGIFSASISRRRRRRFESQIALMARNQSAPLLTADSVFNDTPGLTLHK